VRGFQAVQLIQNHGRNAVRILEDITVPESHNDIAHCLELGRPIRIANNRGSVAMLPAIHLNDEVVLKAHEVDDMAADWSLAFELQTIEPSSAKKAPHLPFGVSGVAPHVAGQLPPLIPPHLGPLPSGERGPVRTVAVRVRH
jgi:hypothetical protein